MIIDLFFTIINSLLSFLTNLIPDIPVGALNGLPAVGTYIGQIITLTKPFVPWSDILFMISIMFSITGIRLSMQVVNLLWP
jgi:hypothetical protein